MISGFAHWLWAAVLAVVIAALPASGSAQDAQNFYRNKQLTMLIASGAGGGYDAYARTLARYMTKHIPGNPVIVPKNVPGAGGLIAANTLFNNAAPDGLTFAALTNGVAMDPLFGEKAGRFEAQKFTWLGSGTLANLTRRRGCCLGQQAVCRFVLSSLFPPRGIAPPRRPTGAMTMVRAHRPASHCGTRVALCQE
jgi:hypothetical protein